MKNLATENWLGRGPDSQNILYVWHKKQSDRQSVHVQNGLDQEASFNTTKVKYCTEEKILSDEKGIKHRLLLSLCLIPCSHT